MILLLCAIAAIGFAVIAVLFFDDCGLRGWLAASSLVLDIFVWIAVVIMVLFAIAVNVGVDGEIAAKQQIHDSLVYQLEHNLYDNDNDIGKQELYEKITDWNADLARGKTLQDNFWIGIFYPNIYDRLEFIELAIGSE